MIEIPKSDKFLVIDKDSINKDDEKSIITQDHFKTTRFLNSLIFSIFALFVIYLIYRMK